MKKLMMSALTILAASPAFATGGFNCDYDDSRLKFTLNGVTSRGFLNAVVDAEASLKGQIGGKGETDVHAIDKTFKKADVMQYWNAGNEFRIGLYVENQDPNAPHEWTTVMIQTKTKDGEKFSGKVEFTHDGVRESGKITCFVE